MSDKLRIKIAAGVTALFLAAISLAGVMAHTNQLPHATATSAHVRQAHIQTPAAPLRHQQEHD